MAVAATSAPENGMGRTSPLSLIVVADHRIPRIAEAWSELRSALERPEIRILAVDREYQFDYSVECGADLVVVLGGDGAMLRTCRQMGHAQRPMIGVNFGRLGFLADLSADEFTMLLPALAARDYRVMEHLMFQCTRSSLSGARQIFLGLNEVVISNAAALRMIDVHLEINGEPVTTYSGDGLIVSTAVGSTAYNLSAGGPILRQDLQAFVITPICPHTLTNRPLVDSANCVYTLNVPEIPPGTTLVVDGQVKEPLAPGDRIEIRRAEITLRLARVPGHSFYRTLYRKLGWGGQPRYTRERDPQSSQP